MTNPALNTETNSANRVGILNSAISSEVSELSFVALTIIDSKKSDGKPVY
jgi:hypothetical protein